MKKILIILLLLPFLFTGKAQAVYDPLSVPNNRIGVHILFPEELASAAELVNSSGGDWGYVTIPIQAGDRDLVKWQSFMNESRRLHLIPLVRLATQNFYFNTNVWEKARHAEVLDFANFLDSLKWPTKNRYVILYNEVNRADEWGGEANPAEYADILSYATDVFKTKSDEFFIISSGMDNAAATGNGTYSQYDFFRLMNEAKPGIFNQIDGFSSHAYPNPAFAQLPSVNTPQSISSFIYEIELINSMSEKELPVFITETGWDQSLSSDIEVGEYFKEAFSTTWNDAKIVAITPFLLHSGPGPFEKFSLIKNDGNKNEVFNAIASFQKTKGIPHTNIFTDTEITQNIQKPTKRFSDGVNHDIGEDLKYFVKWLLFPL
jgi:hypothetical protein